MKKLNWRCYVCGKPVEEKFALTSMQDETDRVFLGCSEKCVRQLDEVYILYVKRTKEENTFVQRNN